MNMVKRSVWIFAVQFFWAFAFVGLLSRASVADDSGIFSIGGRAANFEPVDGNGTWQGGAKARLNLPLFFGVEASFDHRSNDLGTTHIHDWPVQLSALGFFPKIFGLQPYLLAGGGWYDTKVEGPNGFSATQDRFGPHVGAGLDFNIDSHWYIDASYRFIWLSEVHSIDTANQPIGLKDRGHMITLGLNYRI